MTVRGVAAALVLAMGVGGCSDDAPSTATTTAPLRTSTTSTSTVPERPASTTTTAFDPASVEGQVEAAYLKSWDVYAHAVYHLELDEQAFAEVYAGEGLANVTSEVSQRIADGRSALVRVEHDYDIVVASPTEASVVDHYRNHQVLIDSESKQPLEADPNEKLLFNFVMHLIDGTWRVVLVQRVTP